MTQKKKLAIACQGGGSHTAFTAGVLKKLLEKEVQHHYNLIGLSGTSGGALCATLTWIGLLEEAKGEPGPVYKRLINFWQANSAISAWEKALNNFTIELLKLQDKALIPSFAPNPYSQQGVLKTLMSMTPRKEYLDFEQMLVNRIPFQQIPHLIEADSPRLLMGAANVLSGEFKAFDSKLGEINVEAVKASAAIPSLFMAVRIGEELYWDGIFSENPPISGFVEKATEDGLVDPEEMPEELWVVLVNPKERNTEPTTAQDILDRRNELSGNLSLFQQIRFIETINKWIVRGIFTPEFIDRKQLKPIKVRFIGMSPEVGGNLDYVSKLDRDPDFIEMLIEDGEKQAQTFWDELLAGRDPHAVPSPPPVEVM